MIKMTVNNKVIDYDVIPNNLFGKTFVITGLLIHCSKKDLTRIIKESGGHIADKVYDKVNFVINNNLKSRNSKMQKARELNIPIITEEQLITMLGINYD